MVAVPIYPGQAPKQLSRGATQPASDDLTKYIAAGALVAGAAMMVVGNRRAGLVVAAAGTALGDADLSGIALIPAVAGAAAAAGAGAALAALAAGTTSRSRSCCSATSFRNSPSGVNSLRSTTLKLSSCLGSANEVSLNQLSTAARMNQQFSIALRKRTSTHHIIKTLYIIKNTRPDPHDRSSQFVGRKSPVVTKNRSPPRKWWERP